MSRTIQIGGLDRQLLALQHAAGLPVLQDEGLVDHWVNDCVDQAVTDRRGVILMAVAGAGKTLAIELTRRGFDELEARRKALEPSYQVRRLAVLTTLTTATRRETLVELYRAAFETSPNDRMYRRAKTDDELREDLIARCIEENVVTFIVDEAQTLSTAAMTTLRDLMAVSEARDRARIEMLPQARVKAGSAESVIRPAGIGVLLAGTYALATVLDELPEFGRRWTRVERVGPLAPESVPGLMRQFLPAFSAGADTLGSDAWSTLVTRQFTKGHPIAMSALYDVTRCYLRRSLYENPDARELTDLPWDKSLFEHVIREQAGYTLLGEEAAA